jgi:capsular exopolysaccharide synthesis family protein
MDDELSLRDFFAMLRRRRKEFALVWGGIFCGTLAYTMMVTPLYRAQVIFRVEVSDDVSSHPAEQSIVAALQGPQQTFDIEQLLSPQIVQEAVKRMDRAHPETEASQDKNIQQLFSRASVQFSDRDRQLVSLSVISPHGKQAAYEANELSKVMVEQVIQDATAKAHQSKQFIEDQLKETQARLTESEDRLRHFQEKFGPKTAENMQITRLMELRGRRDQLSKKYTSSYPELQEVGAEIRRIEKQLQQVPLQEVDLARVAREVHLNEEMYTMLMKRLEESRIVESARLAPIMIVDPASEPTTPEYPNTRFNLMVGFILGLFISLTYILAREHFDTSMVTTEEIEAYLQLSVLATIPHIERRELRKDTTRGPVPRRRDRLGESRARLICHFPPQSPFAEVYHILRNNLLKGAKVQQSQVYLFTSSVVAEGKSTTAANFAIAAAQAGIPTLLAEVDLRKPMVDKLFDLKQEAGITNYFYLSPRWESCVADWETIKKGSPMLANAINSNGMGNLHVLPSGKLPTNPVSLLSSDRFVQLVKDMKRRYPLVVLDGAPTMLFADSAILGQHVDGVILVYRFGRTAREVLSRAHNQLSTSNAKILGVVVNDIQKGDGANYDTYYSQYAYEEHPPEPLDKIA